ATTLARQGRGRGLAEHWQGLKYCQALATGPGWRHMALTDEGQSPELSYRAMQARELGRAFGLAVAERTVRNRFPDHMISTLDAEAILLAGFARSGPRPSRGARPRPDTSASRVYWASTTDMARRLTTPAPPWRDTLRLAA
ncbi:hypothetical protein ABT026_30830, partial [Streptomyces sp. NPDC002734]